MSAAVRKHRKCEICDIKEKDCREKLLFAKFPLREDICKQWVKVTGKEDLVYLPIEKLHQLRYVCGNHFKKRDFSKSKTRLKKNAIPKLDLRLDPLPDELLKGFPLHIFKSKEICDKSQASAAETATTSHEVQGEIVEKQTASVAGPSKTIDYKGVIKDAAAHLPLDVLDICQVPDVAAEEEITTTSQNVPNKVLVLDSIAIHSPKKICRYVTHAQCTPKSPERRGIKRKIFDDAIELTPKKKKLLEDLRKTRCTLRSLRKSALILENIQSPVLQEIVLNAAKNQSRRAKGRRWTIKNKISALAILKRSARTYRFLNQVIPLPSEKTLQNMLKKVPIQLGINKSVLLHLKKIAPKKLDKDKVCCLLFDEMAIKPRLILNPTNDIIEGYEDLGELGRKAEIADHALVFMLQGLHQKYKQPIAFYFTKGTISSADLAVIIKKIVAEVTATGFQILNTVCDQGPTNMGALKLLKDQSGPVDANNYFKLNNEKNLHCV